jgi:protein-disulfide isomerase
MVRCIRQVFAIGVLMASAVNWANAAGEATRPVSRSSVDALLAPPLATPASGDPKAKVTVVEFFDYQCPICRGIEPDLKKLVDQDHNVRIVHKDLPVFGAASQYAAYCSFAAARLGKYEMAHDALIASHIRLETSDAVRSVLSGAGFDVKSLDADIAQHEREYATVLARNRREATALGIKGTPGVIVGTQVVKGSIDYDRLARLAKP